VATHGIRHGAAAALAATHLRHRPEVDLRTVELGFPTEAEIPDDVNVGQLIADFGAAASTIAAVVSVEQVIKDTPRQC
jgi:hypothetical protein